MMYITYVEWMKEWESDDGYWFFIEWDPLWHYGMNKLTPVLVYAMKSTMIKSNKNSLKCVEHNQLKFKFNSHANIILYDGYNNNNQQKERTGRPQDVLDTALSKMSVTFSNTTGEFFVFISDPGTQRYEQRYMLLLFSSRLIL